MRELQTRHIKRRSLAKMQWAVRAYSEWRINHIKNDDTFDVKIFDSDLEKPESLTEENLAFALMCFIPEITKVKDGAPDPGATLYQLVVAIQRHLNEKGLDWKLIDGPKFRKVKTVLDNVMKEHVRDNIGMVKKQAEVITFDFQDMLWQKGILGEQIPNQLRATVLFLI